MCGIIGICSLFGPRKISLQTLNRMNQALLHRGPDQSGVYLDDNAGIGNARLSIIDIEGGAQPICNEDKSLWIVYNGEIFNYRKLRKQLLESGHRFTTASDTEVILHLYEQYGEDCLNRVNGQFAMAIWDTRRKQMFLARDRVGIRPLHYFVKNGWFYFASEIKSLLASGAMECRIDPVGLEQIFTFWTTLPGQTAFKDIQELPPGHYMKVSAERLEIVKYWDFPLPTRDEYHDMDPGEISEGLRPLIFDAVRIRLIADVPVGSYLSGGLDSSGITAIVARHFNRDVETFGISFDSADFDESIYQDLMAKHLNLRHHELKITDTDISEHFPDLIWHCEKPILRTAPVPLFLLSRLVSENGLKVILTGEGADEVFGGYDIFKEALIRRFWARNPDSPMRADLITRIYPNIFKQASLKRSIINFFGQGLDECDDPLFSHLIRWNNTKRIKQFFSEEIKNEIGDYDCIQDLREMLPAEFASCDCLTKAQYLESKLFLSNYLLSSQGDRPAMAHSVEGRMPYLDYRIIEFMSHVPSAWKILGLNEKFILKKTLSDLLPEGICNRQKNPYRAPIHGSLAQICKNFSSKAIGSDGYFNTRKVEILFKKFENRTGGSEVEAMALSGIVSTRVLHSRFITNGSRTGCNAPASDTIYDYRSNLLN